MVFSTLSIYAKTYYSKRERPDQLMFHITPTVSSLVYNSSDSRSNLRPNMGFGVEYSHFFVQHLGLSIGSELTTFNSTYVFKGRKDSLELFDNWSSRYYTLKQNLSTKEYQRVTYLSLPVKFHYRYNLNRQVNFNASIGVAYSLHISEKKSIISGTIDRRAFFENIYVEIDDFHPLMFGKFGYYIHPSPEKQFKSTLLGIAQSGLSFKISENWNMHTELNIQYGIYKTIKNRSINLLVPDEYAGVTATNYIGNIRPLSFGIRLGFVHTFDLFDVDCKCHKPLK